MTNIQDVKRVHGGFIQGEIINGVLHVHKIFGEEIEVTRLNWKQVSDFEREITTIHNAMDYKAKKDVF
jgi:hypothetical protein